MARVYDHKTVESTWSTYWYKDNIYKAEDFSLKPKKYILAEFPYPSGKSLHAGHMMRYTVPDVYSRYLRMKGFNVLFPMGWDAFGLPAENYAVKTGVHPAITTRKAIEDYKLSFQKMGYGIDWAREINTTDPNYYKWTQWLFLKFWEAGLADYKELPVWWCEELKTVLAEEEVLTDKDGNKISERGGYKVTRKNLKQWSLKITKYADKLLEGLKHVDFPEAIKSAQTNWIGKSEGAQIKFELCNEMGTLKKDLMAFTTRPDTIFGITFIAISPENPIIAEIMPNLTNSIEVIDYISRVSKKSDLDRKTSKNKTGVLLQGLFAKHPLQEVVDQIPVFISEYVLGDYGTGTIMGVPAHDERDMEFANAMSLRSIKVIDSDNEMINSFGYNSKNASVFTEEILLRLENEKKGYRTVTYKIRDWLFSRQRYWGEPIPLLHSDNGEIIPIADTSDAESIKSNLPLKLPEVPDYSPTSDGNSPLSKNKDWLTVTGKDGRIYHRETNTMPNWAGSCWYYIRYTDPNNSEKFADSEKLKYWLPVDKYFGGSEHTTMHLLYSRFWHQFFYDQGLVPTPEPYAWRMNGGLLLGPDGRKMSKSIGNIIDPMDMVDAYGADALRLYICFIGPYEDTYPWNPSGIKSCYKLISNIYNLAEKVRENYSDSKAVKKSINILVKNVTHMAENLKMNTCISEFMIFMNTIAKEETISKEVFTTLLKVLSPFAPFASEYLWMEMNKFTSWNASNSIHLTNWPIFDPSLLVETTISIPVQINSKVRGNVEIHKGSSQDDVFYAVQSNPIFTKYLDAGEIKKVIYVPDKVISLIVS